MLPSDDSNTGGGVKGVNTQCELAILSMPMDEAEWCLRQLRGGRTFRCSDLC